MVKQELNGGKPGLLGLASKYAVNTVLDQLQKRARTSRTQTVTRRSVDIGDRDVVTTQHDSAIRFMKGKMSKGARRKVKFTKKVRNAIVSDVGLRSYLASDGGARKTTLADSQIYDGAMIGGIAQTSNDEMLRAFRVAYETPAGGITSFINRKVMVKSICLDVHLTNNSSNTVEIDVYQVKLRRDWAANDRIDVMYYTTYLQAAGAVAANPVIGTATKGYFQIGNTPFQNSNFCEHWKILSKRTIMMSTGQSTSLQMRVGRKFVDGNALQRYQFGIPGYTKGYLFVMRGAPRWNGTAVERGAVDVVWTQERTMTVARGPDGQNQDITITT